MPDSVYGCGSILAISLVRKAARTAGVLMGSTLEPLCTAASHHIAGSTLGAAAFLLMGGLSFH